MFSSYAFLSNFSLGLLLKILFSSGLGLLYNSVMQELCNSLIFKIANRRLVAEASVLKAPKTDFWPLQVKPPRVPHHSRIKGYNQRMGTKLGQWTGLGRKNREREVLQRTDQSGSIVMKCLTGDLRMQLLSCLQETATGWVGAVSHSCHPTQASGSELDGTEPSFPSLLISTLPYPSGLVYS